MGPQRAQIKAVLFDRDGTLVRDVPYNRDPALVEPMPGAREAVDRLRAAGLRVGVVTNQSGIAKRLITLDELRRVNARVEELLGPFDVWAICRHGAAAGCRCRKPKPGLVIRAATALRVRPAECVVVGDIGTDVMAAEAAGATGILVPTPQTLPDEVLGARYAVADLAAAADLILGAPVAEAV